MTIVSSVRQLVETPIYAMNEGTSPILSYNYGARRPARVRKAMCVMSAMILGYTAVMWSVIVLAPHALIGIFSSDAVLTADAVPALKQYFAAFIFMDLQYIGQTVFKSLNKKKQAIFFSLLRKVFIVVPLAYLMPYVLHMGTDGVFLAEPVSNVIGGSLCFITMLDSGSAGIEANGTTEVIVLKFLKKYRKIFAETVSADIFLFFIAIHTIKGLDFHF